MTPNLVSCAGLAPLVALGARCGLGELVADRLTLRAKGGVKAPVKVSALVAGMAAGADSIDDMDVLRHGGMLRLFDGLRAPSTLGTFRVGLRIVKHEALRVDDRLERRESGRPHQPGLRRPATGAHWRTTNVASGRVRVGTKVWLPPVVGALAGFRAQEVLLSRPGAAWRGLSWAETSRAREHWTRTRRWRPSASRGR